MIRFKSSIRGRLMLFIMSFVVIVVGLAASSVVGLRAVGLKTEQRDQKWLMGTAVLGAIADGIAEYRIAEAYRALAPDPKAKAEAEAIADKQPRAIQDLQNKSVKLLGNDTQNAGMDSLLVALYTYYDLLAAHATSAAVNHLVDEATIIAIAVSVGAFLLTIWLLIRIHSQITQPLGAITQALSALATGNREIRVPELHRSDEIGEMAKAFEVFRTNALALEQAHEATRVAEEQAHALARYDPLNPAAVLALAVKGCEFGKRYHFGKAMTADSAGELLNSSDDIRSPWADRKVAAVSLAVDLQSAPAHRGRFRRLLRVVDDGQNDGLNQFQEIFPNYSRSVVGSL
jgi:methyl-accepting chemotaxis protein